MNMYNLICLQYRCFMGSSCTCTSMIINNTKSPISTLIINEWKWLSKSRMVRYLTVIFHNQKWSFCKLGLSCTKMNLLLIGILQYLASNPTKLIHWGEIWVHVFWKLFQPMMTNLSCSLLMESVGSATARVCWILGYSRSCRIKIISKKYRFYTERWSGPMSRIYPDTVYSDAVKEHTWQYTPFGINIQKYRNE